MTNAELETLYRSQLGLSQIAALRLIYDLGYCDGAGIDASVTPVEPSATQAKPSEAKIAGIKKFNIKP